MLHDWMSQYGEHGPQGEPGGWHGAWPQGEPMPDWMSQYAENGTWPEGEPMHA